VTGDFSPFHARDLMLWAILITLYVGAPYALMASARRNPRTWKAVCSIIIVIAVISLVNLVRLL